MKVALYARVSTTKADQKPDVQLRELRKYCKARKFKILHEIIDQATGVSDDRPGLKQLLELVKQRKVVPSHLIGNSFRGSIPR